MAKEHWKPGNMLYPVPAVMVSCGREEGTPNILTVAWAGTICSDPAMVSISVRKERFSHPIIKETGEFVINLVNRKLVRAADYCGVKSGREADKFAEARLTPQKSRYIKAPGIEESPVNIECRVTEVKELGTHDMFIAQVVGVTIDNQYMDEKGKFNLNASGLVSYSHGEYFELGKKLGSFGYSVKKTIRKRKPSPGATVRGADAGEKKPDSSRKKAAGKGAEAPGKKLDSTRKKAAGKGAGTGGKKPDSSRKKAPGKGAEATGKKQAAAKKQTRRT